MKLFEPKNPEKGIFDKTELNDFFSELTEQKVDMSEDALLEVILKLSTTMIGPGGYIRIKSEDSEEFTDYQPLYYIPFTMKLDQLRYLNAGKSADKIIGILKDVREVTDLYAEQDADKFETTDIADLGSYFNDSTLNITWTVFKSILLPEIPDKAMVNFFILEVVFPRGDHQALKKQVLSSQFMEEINEDFLELVDLLELEKEYKETDVEDSFFKVLSDEYFMFINAKISDLYLESDSYKEGDGVVLKSLRYASLEEFFDATVNLLSEKITDEKKKQKVEIYLRRILDAAHRNKIPFPIDQMQKKVQEEVGMILDILDDDIEEIMEESLNFGFPSRLEKLKAIKRAIYSADESEEAEIDEETLEGYIPEGGWRALEIKEITAEGVVDFFTEQGFEFENQKKFEKQFKSLLFKTAYSKQKKTKLLQMLNKPPRDSWNFYGGKGEYGPHSILKIDAGGEALRIVRSGNTIENFLNHDKYDRIYVKDKFN